MNIYDFDECVLLDNKGKNTVKIQPREISIEKCSLDSATEIEIRGVLRDYDWKPTRRQVDYNALASYHKLYGAMFWEMPKIKNVIFNDPATIVFWADGTKTVVKCQDDDIFDPEKGLAMAISKKALGNKGNYCNELKKWLPKEEEVTLEYVLNTSPQSINDIGKSIVEEVNERLNRLERSK